MDVYRLGNRQAFNKGVNLLSVDLSSKKILTFCRPIFWEVLRFLNGFVQRFKSLDWTVQIGRNQFMQIF